MYPISYMFWMPGQFEDLIESAKSLTDLFENDDFTTEINTYPDSASAESEYVVVNPLLDMMQVCNVYCSFFIFAVLTVYYSLLLPESMKN